MSFNTRQEPARRNARRLVAGLLTLSSSTILFADGTPRSVDGSNNNAIDASMGQSFTPLLRMGNADYSDGVSAMSGELRPNPREISVAIGSMPAPEKPYRGPSDYLWAWGQFIDHDISITASAHPVEPAFIPVPAGDPWFDPQSSGNVMLRFNRSIHDSASGTGTDNPRQQINEITAWIDASNVYGSNETRANALRALDGTGKMQMSARRLLPFNTDGLPNEGGTGSNLFLAGDVRANEQIGLTALHTLFVREHNRLATVIARKYPELSGEEIYQKARKVVAAQLQRITYNEFLPTLLGNRPLARYTGYKPWIDASIANEFSTALYRFGHSAIGSTILRLNGRLNETRHGNLSLQDAFFAPQRLVTEGGIGPVLRGLAKQTANPVDLAMVDDLRHFLFGPPGAGGLDLAALNIQRGRDHGLGDYNSTRAAYGLSRVTDFSDISADPTIQATLMSLYGSVDDIDLWVGALAEDTHAGMVGELLYTGLRAQFEALRDGDSYWYGQRGAMTSWEKRQLRKLSAIIRMNSGVGAELQNNVFRYRPR